MVAEGGLCTTTAGTVLNPRHDIMLVPGGDIPAINIGAHATWRRAEKYHR
jgi:hypothetical protein